MAPVAGLGVVGFDYIQDIGEDVEYNVLDTRIRQMRRGSVHLRVVALTLPMADIKAVRDWLG